MQKIFIVAFCIELCWIENNLNINNKNKFLILFKYVFDKVFYSR